MFFKPLLGFFPARKVFQREGMTCKEFLKAHREVLAATDFFTVEVCTGRGLVRYHVLFVIQLVARAVEIAGVRLDTDRVKQGDAAPNTSGRQEFLENLINEFI